MKVIVTGGAGFIGSHLCKALLDLNYKVICIDNFFTGRYKNIRDLVNNPNFKLVKHDIIDPLKVTGRVDYIFNLACPASPVAYQIDPVKTVKANTAGMINMLELAKSTGARILQASTSEVYGDPEVHPQTEDYWGNVNPIGLRSNYDEGKRVAETLCFDYKRQYNTDIRVVRIFNTYGPNMDLDDGRVVSNFVVQALRGEDLTLYGEGTQTRSFCYVSDMVAGLLKMMFNEKFSGPVNLGNPNEISMLELAKIVLDNINSASGIVHKPLPQDDPKQRNPDISLAKEKLGWEPAVNFDVGIQRTIEYFKLEVVR